MIRRNDLEPLQRAVSDALDELNHRMHGLVSSDAYPDDFLGLLAEHGYAVVPAACPETAETQASPAPRRHRCVLGPHSGPEHRCRCGMVWAPLGDCL